jgi:Type VI secretion system (T6SS), amidase effector protein 4
MALKQSHEGKTNGTPNSVCTIDVPVITFKQLWDNYVTGNPLPDPTHIFENQCAIRMSATLHKVGIQMKSFSQKVIKPAAGQKEIGRALLNGLPVATRASEMAQWLRLKPFCGLPSKPEDITGHDWQDKVKGRTGIIMFDGYWHVEGQAANVLTGGHIDLWNKDRLTPGWASFVRFTLGFNSARVFDLSDLGNAKQILFWAVR